MLTLRAEKLVTACVLGGLIPLVFLGSARLLMERAVLPPRWFITPLDERITVAPEAVWIYLTWYPATAAVLCAGSDTFRHAWRSYLLALCVCVSFYIAAPIMIDRGPAELGTSLSDRTLAVLRQMDPPVNLFPSYHAALAMILCHLRPRNTAYALTVGGWTFALLASCVLTKQHYVLDVVAGCVVGTAAFSLVHRSRGSRSRPRPLSSGAKLETP